MGEGLLLSEFSKSTLKGSYPSRNCPEVGTAMMECNDKLKII
jgi:hypothetical protein